MDYSIRPMDGSELMYAYPQSAQISAQTGCIGKLTGSIDKDGDALLTNWKDVIPGNKTDGFKADLDAVLGTLRRGNGADAFLKDRLTLFMFCSDRPGSRIDGTHEFAFRLDMIVLKDYVSDVITGFTMLTMTLLLMHEQVI